MTIWLNRAGAHGEYELKFIQDSRIYATWDRLSIDLSRLKSNDDLVAEMTRIYDDAKSKTITNWVSQVWPFAHEMKKGDLVILPLKTQRAIQVGEITSEYHFDQALPDPFFHWRSVKWIGEAVPRAHFGQDLLNSFGAFMTICRIQRNNAEARMAAMRASNWKPEAITAAVSPAANTPMSSAGEQAGTDLEEAGHDQIARLIEAHFKGHELTRLVDAILRAQGYITYQSPEGPDGGVDILAGAGPLGFGRPRLCVEVKSESSPIDRSTVDKLLGAISKFSADEGLFVSWSGFRSTVQKELASSFFKVRLWSQKELLEALFTNYEHLDDDLKAELPLKKIWTVAIPNED